MSNGAPPNYVEVSERIAEVFARYPDGSHTGTWEVRTIGEETLIIYRSVVYRTPDDQRPSVAFASEPFPGRTNFTRGSELMNAETSAVGRALALLGFRTNRAVASAEEIRAQQEQAAANPPILSDDDVEGLVALLKDSGIGFEQLCLSLGSIGADAPKIKRKDSIRKALASLTENQAGQLTTILEGARDAQEGETPDA